MRNPMFSICEFTTPDTSFEEDLELYAVEGATGIGIAEEKLVAGKEDAQLDAFKSSGLTATVCLPTNIGVLPIRPQLIYGGPTDPRERIAAMCDSIRRIAQFEPDCIVVGTGSGEGWDETEARKVVIAGLREASQVAADLGTRLALEPCRKDLGFDASIVQGLQAAVDLIDEIDSPSIGICYDVYHHWHEDGIVELTQNYAKRIFGVQVNDWHEPARGFADRLLPGDGIMDLPALFAALERGGFDGWYDLEIFSDDGRWGTTLEHSVWALPSEEIARRGMAGMWQAWRAAGEINAAP